MALVEVKVPDIGDFKDVAVIEVFVKPGDTIKVEQSLITVESDKASMEIPSSHAGVLKELKVKLGDKVNIGDLLALLDGADAASAPTAVPAASANPAAATAAAAQKKQTEAAAAAAEIAAALRAGVKCINVESIAELRKINRVATELQIRAPISLRVNPDVDAQTHPYISTGLKGNKFGIAYHEVLKTYREVSQLPQIDVVGIDCHIGSQITTTAPYLDALDKVLDLVEHLKREGIIIHHLDLGGGLGISYSDETPPDITEFTNTLLNRVAERGFGHLDVVLEPGRSLVGNAGVLLTTVEYLKPGVEKNFCIVDAAMTELMRPALYEAHHGIVPVHKKSAKELTYDIVGPVCESGDWLGRDRSLAVEEGDLLAILSAGAYGFVMASNYNTRPKPAEIMVDGKNAYVIRARENTNDLFASENLLPK